MIKTLEVPAIAGSLSNTPSIMSSLKDYLSKYADTPAPDTKKKLRKKKKKEQDTTTNTSASIVDDDDGDTLLSSSHASKRSSRPLTFDEYSKRRKMDSYGDDEDDEESEEDQTASTKKPRAWKRLDGSTKQNDNPQDPAATSSASLSLHNKYFGLQTAEQIAAQVREKEQAEAAVRAALQHQSDAAATVYRDDSGRRIADIERVREDKAAAEAAQKRERERAHVRVNAGIVQQNTRDQDRKSSSQDLRYTRHADDASLNAQQRLRVDLFNDPAASFLKNKPKLSSSASYEPTDTDSTAWRTYQGPHAPNRFGIVPGSMWDGVDRSNGFEKLWFQKDSEIKEKKLREYTSSYDI